MYLSIKNYAAKFSISPDTVRRAIKEGRLEACKIGARTIRIHEDALIQAPVVYKPTDKNEFLSKVRSL